MALNAERADEERRGVVRWLRPAFQNPGGQAAVQADLGLDPDESGTGGKAGKGAAKAVAKRPAWPSALAEQARVLRAALAARPAPSTPAELARLFVGAPEPRVTELLEVLASLRQARPVDGGRYAV